MFNLVCDRCGKGLLIKEDVRYEVTIEIKSAYDVMEITHEDLKKNFDEEIRRLLDVMNDKNQEELEDEVYKRFEFDLCRECQKKMLKDPLFQSRSNYC